MSIAYLNGEFIPLSDAKVSVMDRGFLYADGVYETIPAYNGQLFLIDSHIRRLQNSLAAVDISVESKAQDWKGILQELIDRNGGGDLSVYLQVTRGPDAIRQHQNPEHAQPTTFACVFPLTPPSVEYLAKGVKAITVPDIRWHRCNIKSISLLANVMALNQAKQQQAEEAIFINDNYAVEGSHSNLFVVIDGQLISPPAGAHILGGTTRDLIIDLAKQQQMECQERMITRAELFAADEIWLSSCTKEIRPVVLLDDTPINRGQAGPLWNKMIEFYKDFKRKTLYG